MQNNQIITEATSAEGKFRCVGGTACMHLEINLKTLTPLWTGGVEQTCDRLHETGLIGSLRWWYEALVRGLGGYACDPTDEHSKCKEYDPEMGTRSICAACYLFGTTGWARLFRLQAEVENLIPLHFYTTLPSNERWLNNIFRGKSRQIDEVKVPFGAVRLAFVTRGQDEEYALRQIAWVLEFAARQGGLGAKLQHGFGQVALLTSVAQYSATAKQELKKRLGEFKSEQNNPEYPKYPTLQRFFSHLYPIAGDNPVLQAILAKGCIGKVPRSEVTFIPCAFDLRYKGGQVANKQLGFRQWLLDKKLDKKWQRRDINALLGETQAQRDDKRQGSRVYFGMPWRNEQQGYMLRVFGFVPPEIDKGKVEEELNAYLNNMFGPQGGQ